MTEFPSFLLVSKEQFDAWILPSVQNADTSDQFRHILFLFENLHIKFMSTRDVEAARDILFSVPSAVESASPAKHHPSSLVDTDQSETVPVKDLSGTVLGQIFLAEIVVVKDLPETVPVKDRSESFVLSSKTVPVKDLSDAVLVTVSVYMSISNDTIHVHV